jgi:hypothetical protein
MRCSRATIEREAIGVFPQAFRLRVPQNSKRVSFDCTRKETWDSISTTQHRPLMD